VIYGSNAIIMIEIDLASDTVRITIVIKRYFPRPCRESFLPRFIPPPAESSDSSPPQVFTWLVSLHIRAHGIYGGCNWEVIKTGYGANKKCGKEGGNI
jgi:hypothetical protein